ncbi:hypothetical protein B0H67DRAFT_587899 [Lasiosphaeris hirsuta]|uniref:Uncharacterized protein n=1 Tax=Lasiosphaeris hirsuta TaxID=260670 RepID=A0AA40A1L0_9PEZI|nr:hypothetical protein B0H67DRAFT_587899 [Lasiosphaeris hirsuta]
MLSTRIDWRGFLASCLFGLMPWDAGHCFGHIFPRAPKDPRNPMTPNPTVTRLLSVKPHRPPNAMRRRGSQTTRSDLRLFEVGNRDDNMVLGAWSPATLASSSLLDLRTVQISLPAAAGSSSNLHCTLH